jgi:hypothetical protein
MATRNALRLSIKAYANIAQSQLTHEALLTIRATERHGNRTLYTSVGSGTIWRKPRGLEGKNLIRSELLLIEGSLLTLECFDLVLKCNLFRHNAPYLTATFIPSLQNVLVGITRGGLLLRKLETNVFFTDGRANGITRA